VSIAGRVWGIYFAAMPTVVDKVKT
jgi:hypothetical protein